MKAWELTRDLLRNTKPIIRTAEEQTWDASAVMAAGDMMVAMFWKSNVPGSAAPECTGVAGWLRSGNPTSPRAVAVLKAIHRTLTERRTSLWVSVVRSEDMLADAASRLQSAPALPTRAPASVFQSADEVDWSAASWLHSRLPGG